MSKNVYDDVLIKVFNEHITDYKQYIYSSSKYCGGDSYFSASAEVRYNPNAPAKSDFLLNCNEHKAIEDFQIRFFSCPNCKSGESNFYLSTLNVKDLNSSGFGYTSLNNEYYCATCHLEYHVEGKWDW